MKTRQSPSHEVLTSHVQRRITETGEGGVRVLELDDTVEEGTTVLHKGVDQALDRTLIPAEKHKRGRERNELTVTSRSNVVKRTGPPKQKGETMSLRNIP